MRHIPTILALLAVGALLAAGCAADGGGQEATVAPAATPAPATTSGGTGTAGGGGRGSYGRGDYGDQPATSDSSGGGAAGGAVRIAGFAFSPKLRTARVGQKVTWENQDASTIHTVTALDGSFGSGQLQQGDQFSHVFRRAGTFAYHCSIHPTMRGTVKVTG